MPTILLAVIGAMLHMVPCLPGDEARATQAENSRVEFRISAPRNTEASERAGRLVIYLIRDGAAVDEGAEPGDGPFFGDPQPMFGVDVADGWDGSDMLIGPETEGVVAFPAPLGALPPGRYQAQAVLDSRRENSSWRREPGNRHSDVVTFEATADGTTTVDLPLLRRVGPVVAPAHVGVEYVEIPSRLLSEFRGQPVVLRAGVLPPIGHVPGRPYPAIYEVPGFGGDHTGILRHAQRRELRPRDSVGDQLDTLAFRIVLDPEGPNGHHLFADSAANGPVGRALTEELIPELTRRFGLIDVPEARLLRGHSSGGWSVLWLATEYPHIFGAAWSSAPDPVDFRRFQAVNIYEDKSMYERPAPGGGAEDTPSYTDHAGVVRMTIRQENQMEEVLGPANTSAQQWDSWLAVFAPAGQAGGGADLYDPVTGAIDPAIAAAMRAHDIGLRLRTRPDRDGPIFRDRIRLVVGDMDNYALHEAVRLLRNDLERIGALGDGTTHHGLIAIVPGLDHSSIHGSREVGAFTRQMLDHIIRSGQKFLRAQPTTP